MRTDGLAKAILESAKPLCEEQMAREGADAYPSTEFMMEVARAQARAVNEYYNISAEAAERGVRVGKAVEQLQIARLRHMQGHANVAAMFVESALGELGQEVR